MNRHVRIAPAARDVQQGFSAEEFCRMIAIGAFEDMRVELVSGKLQKMTPAYGGHGQQNARIVIKLARAFGDQIVAIATDLAVRIDDNTIRGVDIALGRSDFPSGEPTSPSKVLMAIEIADTTLSRDLVDKAVEYARAGIPNYWVVDLQGSVVHVMREPAEGGYGLREVVRFGEMLAVPGTDQTITLD